MEIRCLGAVAGLAAIGVDAGNLVGTIDDVSDDVNLAGFGVPAVEAGEVPCAVVFVAELAAYAGYAVSAVK